MTFRADLERAKDALRLGLLPEPNEGRDRWLNEIAQLAQLAHDEANDRQMALSGNDISRKRSG